MLTLSDGVVLTPGRVDGRDGLSIEDLSLQYDGERTVTFVFARGDKRTDIPIVFPLMLYRGVFEPGRSYVRGDTVTLNGSLYHCNAPTTARPGDGADWTLSVKHGRDGRSGHIGAVVLGERLEDGTLRCAGKAGSGLTSALIDELEAALVRRPTSPFDSGSVPAGTTFVEPTHRAVIEFTEWTATRTLRHPTFKALLRAGED